MFGNKEIGKKYNEAQYTIAGLTAENEALGKALVEKIKRIEELEAQIATYETTTKEQAEKINTLYVENIDIEKERDIYKKSYDEAYSENNILRKKIRNSGDKSSFNKKDNSFEDTCKEYARSKNYNERKDNPIDEDFTNILKGLLNNIDSLSDGIAIFGII